MNSPSQPPVLDSSLLELLGPGPDEALLDYLETMVRRVPASLALSSVEAETKSGPGDAASSFLRIQAAAKKDKVARAKGHANKESSSLNADVIASLRDEVDDLRRRLELSQAAVAQGGTRQEGGLQDDHVDEFKVEVFNEGERRGGSREHVPNRSNLVTLDHPAVSEQNSRFHEETLACQLTLLHLSILLPFLLDSSETDSGRQVDFSTTQEKAHLL